ncbi:acetyltransferase [Rhizobium sp. Root708]|uniref:GNAT family N-acetyltransferase n=1 Tax=Rhizobium sp. Root708 TaxID=1736592 RepID=UPI0006FA16A5|nr:GNAT family N-acetyltransferase [Rhizobium sp. Root708]KRB57126.1 acetyltransferase [Rhizobium sp. Root708]
MVEGSRTIRILQADNSRDVDAFRRIRLEALRNDPEAYASSVEEWECLPIEEWQNRLRHNIVHASFDEEAPTGLMGLMRQRMSKMAHRGTLIMVYTSPAYRGSGIGRALLDAVSNHAGGIGVHQLELAVSAENDGAIRFYLTQGFVEAGRIPDGFMHAGRGVDEILMVRRTADRDPQ